MNSGHSYSEIAAWEIIKINKYVLSLTVPHIYEYHRNNGFVCILLNEIFELM